MSDFEALCSAGRLAAEHMDTGRWVLGDLAVAVGSEYGADMITEFARQVNISQAQARAYRQVASFYESEIRISFLAANPILTWSHFRVAMRKGSETDAYAFLDKAAANTWTIDQCQRELALERPPKPDPTLLDIAVSAPKLAANRLSFAIEDVAIAESFVEAIAGQKAPLRLIVRNESTAPE